MIDRNARAGFTMIEMLVVIGIVAVLTAVVVGNYGSFRSATVATNMAYEAAATVRQAQLYGLGVRLPSGGAGLTDTYGVDFSAESPSYSIFRERGTLDGRCDAGGCDCTDPDGECVEQVRMLQQVEVMALCAYQSASITTEDLLQNCGYKVLTATFTRPNPESTIRASTSAGGSPVGPGGTGGVNDSFAVGAVLVRGGGHCRMMRIYGNGQLAVEGLSVAEVDGTQFSDECTGA